MRTTMKKLILASLLLSTALLAAGSAYAAPLYFPHVDTSLPWQTEIAIINTSDQTVTGTLRGISDGGQLVETKAVTLSARSRRQIVIADEFTNHTNIGYIIFDTNSDAVQGYTKFYQTGKYRAAIPAVKEVNTSDIYISHIDSGAQWWTGVSLVNTTSATKELTITFNNGLSVPYPLNANEHKAFIIGNLFNQPIQPAIKSAVINNASGVIGLELFGNIGGNDHLDGILLTGNTASTLYYPHVDNNGWWTGIVAYNPSDLACSITITPYSDQGTPLTFTPSTRSLAGKEKYVGVVSELNLPAQTAWFKIDSTSPLSGFELFGTTDGNQLAAYAEKSGTGAKEGVFPKIEKNGWTGIAFVNTEDSAASVTLTAYNDAGAVVATQVLPVLGHAKVVNNPQPIFSQDIGSATYIAYSSDRNVVGFQLNGSSDGTMLDGLPGLAGNGNGGGSTCTYEYSQWGACQNSVQTRTVTSATPAGCTGTPVLSRSCTPPSTPSDMVLIPAGSFQMGGIAGEGDVNEFPAHAVTLSAFYLEKYEVTSGLWYEVYEWALVNGYTFDSVTFGVDNNYPVQNPSWYDVVKWLNARSEKEGRTPVYYTNAAQTTATIYKTGQVDITNGMVNWQANGFRLPTEAEWEYAARGGTTTRFYTGDCISSDQANFDARLDYVWSCAVGVYRLHTTPVGSFNANPWGLYDMAGNVCEWVWDWYGSYSSSAVTNPRGPDSGSSRVFRDGGYYYKLTSLRSASRDFGDTPSNKDKYRGFRCALSQP